LNIITIIQTKVSVQSTVRVDDGQLHVIKVGKQKGGDCFLQVDTQEEVRRVGRLGPGDRDIINTRKASLYLGGTPGDVSETTLGLYTEGLNGCVSYLSIENTLGSTTMGSNSHSNKDFYKTREEGGTLAVGKDGVHCGEKCTLHLEEQVVKEEEQEEGGGGWWSW